MRGLSVNRPQVRQFTRVGGVPQRWAGSLSDYDGGRATTPEADGSTIEPAGAVTPNELRGNETVLVVDDDSLVRELMALILRQIGYRVLEACGTGEAQRLTLTNQNIHLLLTDFSMPEINGLELARWFQRKYPKIKVLITTGSLWELANVIGEQESVAILPKPFDSFQLRRMVRLTLG